ncbi:hypothetical protein Sste5346_006110 [Sporothrix stenoceras]|uniref:Alpha/beta hydrolase fold-3 domain-containing protein n=1 Tax=Sporothrix stenoceras TaxID=5173 RepID=A0ABR3Z179_9PEZI
MALPDKEYIRSLVKYDPEFQELCDRTGLFSGKFSVTELHGHMKTILDAFERAVGPTPDDIIETNITYTTRDGTSLRAKLFQPKERTTGKGRPLFVMFHGGGFSSGSPDDETLLCRNLVHALGAVCVAPTYRVAPEHVFPTAAHDAWDALQWAASPETYMAWGADPVNAGFVVGGTASGGNLAAVATHMARDSQLQPPLTGHYLSTPLLTMPEVVPEKYREFYLSHGQNTHSPVMCTSVVHHIVDGVYKADKTEATLFSVLNHPRGHAGLPPAYVQACGLDATRDDALLYEAILRKECKLQTKIGVYLGLPQRFQDLFATFTASTRFRRDQVEGIAWLFGRAPDIAKVVTELKPEDVLGQDPAVSPRPVFY